MHRTPTEIAADARQLVDSSSRAFVPAPIVRIGELSVEFMESAAAELEALKEAAAAGFAPVLATA